MSGCSIIFQERGFLIKAPIKQREPSLSAVLQQLLYAPFNALQSARRTSFTHSPDRLGSGRPEKAN
jgi:hypothetical protein